MFPLRLSALAKVTPRMCFLLALPLVLACLAGCPNDKKKKDDKLTRDPPREVNPGETVTFEFPADGQYHRSPYLALNGQHLLIMPDAKSAGLVTDSGIRMVIDRDEFLIGTNQPMRMQTPGIMAFKIDDKSMRKWINSLTVTIQCID